jgi:phospholipase C
VKLALGVLAVLTAMAIPAAATAQSPSGDHAPRTPIEHYVFLMQENHSFDNYFGTYPGADGIPKGTCMPVTPRGQSVERLYSAPGGAAAVRDSDHLRLGATRSGAPCVRPFRLGNRSIDLPHDVDALQDQYAGGRMDGWIDAVANQSTGPDPAVMGYYDRRDIPFHWKVADDYVLFDRFFQSAGAGSIPNHLFWATGTVGNPKDYSIPTTGFRMPTIFDRLEAAGIPWKFYIDDYDPTINYKTDPFDPQVHWVPLLSFDRFLKNKRLNRHIVDLDQYYEDLRKDRLPAVSFIVPSGQSEHPPGSLATGQRFVNSLVNGLMQSRAWPRSAFMYSYDDWGGWYDHVSPPQVDEFGYGFRVPALLVSPYARRGYIDSTTLDFTSALKFIESNWNLEPLATRDARANNITSAFDFSQPPRPPELISIGTKPAAKKEPNRAVIYGAYGAAVGLAVVTLLVLLLGWGHRRRSGRRGPPPGGGTGGPPVDRDGAPSAAAERTPTRVAMMARVVARLRPTMRLRLSRRPAR